jgi:iron complex transport system substrate-binding protein
LVLASKIHALDEVPQLEKAGLPVFVVRADNLTAILSSIKKVGRVTGKEETAEDLASLMEDRIKEIEDRVRNLHRPKVFYVVWHDPLKTVGNGTFEDELIDKAGGTNIFHDLNGYAPVETEEVVSRDPDVVVTIGGMGVGQDKPFAWAKEEPSLAETSSRKDNRIYQIEGDLIARPGPRIVDALEMLARFIHGSGQGHP